MRSFSCWNQFLCQAFAQLTWRESLRDIEQCLTLFPWADFRQSKAAIKLHTLLNMRGNILTFIRITPGKVHDVRILDHLPIETKAIYIMGRGYLDFSRLNAIHRGDAFFVIRHKVNIIFRRL